MFIPDQKKMAQIILAKRSPDGEESQVQAKPEETVGEPGTQFHAIAEDMLHAFKSGSAHGLVDAMKAFYEQMELNEQE